MGTIRGNAHAGAATPKLPLAIHPCGKLELRRILYFSYTAILPANCEILVILDGAPSPKTVFILGAESVFFDPEREKPCVQY
jgi:hypothetical protein